jgi:uncharacterized protein
VSAEPDTAGPACATGRLYSWSTVHVSASQPVPYTLGYVDLDDGLRVLARLDGDTSELRMDGPVRLAAGRGGLTFAPLGRA